MVVIVKNFTDVLLYVLLYRVFAERVSSFGELASCSGRRSGGRLHPDGDPTGGLKRCHRLRHTAETYVLLRGKMSVVFYDGTGAQVERYLLDHALGNYGVQIPKGQWHTVEVIEPSAIFEVKDGPYMPLDPEDMMD